MSPTTILQKTSLGLLLAVMFGSPIVLAKPGQTAQIQVQAVAQETFSTPEQALQALARAVQTKDRAALAGIFGPDYKQLLSGDRVEDEHAFASFAAALQQPSELQRNADDKYTILVGSDNWPMPIPIVQRGGQWRFDTEAGLNEILNRRIGENELSAITTCRAYVVAQWQYFTEGDHDNDGVAEYAQKFMSSPGRHDGLYWEAAEGEPTSPLGSLVAEARAEGYGTRARTSRQSANQHQRAISQPRSPGHPFHGYYFKILTRQGPHPPGGTYNYIINGNMIGGYALIAYPAKWGNSGIMTFIVNQQGRVYQKNLGPDTSKTTSAITEYDPDQTWHLVDDF